MSRSIIRAAIFGAGGLGKQVIGYMEDDGGYQIEAVISTEPFNSPAYDYPVLPKLPPDLEGCACYLAVAMPAVKRAIVAANPNANWQTYRHHSCYIDSHAKVGKGCVFCPQAMVCGDPVIGDFVFFDTNATVGHDSRIADFSSLFPNSEVCGDCDIGEGVIVGINSSVLPKSSMVAGSAASAHACVRKSVTEPVAVYGDPAKPRGGLFTGPKPPPGAQFLPTDIPRCDICKGSGIESFGLATFPCRRCFPDLVRAA